MEVQALDRRSVRRRRLRVIVSVLVVGLAALAALVVPHVAQTAHAAAPASTCAQPPAGKDPTTFTTQQLKSYGLPLRQPKQNQTTWANMLRHAKHRICAPMATGPAHTHHGTPTSPADSQHYTGHCELCWAGYQVAGSSYNFTNIWGMWQIPCVSYYTSPPGPDASEVAGAWIGLGDDVNSSLVQVGFEIDPVATTIYGPFGIPLYTNVSATYRVWMENTWTYMAGQSFYYFNVNCGDWVMAEVQAPDTMWIGDFQTNNYTIQTYGPAAGGNPAECVLEEPTQSDGLVDFGTVTFSQCLLNDAASGTYGGINQFNSQTDTMQDSSGNVMAYPGPLDPSSTSGDFSIYWNQG